MPGRNSDDSKDFGAKLNAVNDTKTSDAEGSSDDDLDMLRTILSIPQPNALMHEVHKALETAQQKDYLVLSATVPAGSHNRTLKKMSALDTRTTTQGKMYTLFYHFWVIPSVFPTTPQPDVDPCSPMCWASPDAKLNGAMAELYQCVPKDLHKSMEKYTPFDSLFHTAVSAEHSNIVYAIKDCAGIIFSTLKLDPSLFASQTDIRQWNNKALPDVMMADEFLKSPVLVKIVHVEMYGKKILSDKIKGQKVLRTGIVLNTTAANKQYRESWFQGKRQRQSSA
ncbi:hypothetical protein BDR04DRAFT_1149892 [Suillus decipiens]|nr:hypothetical protein BDR04DRAFT_1149892 [Suillus decipiens]